MRMGFDTARHHDLARSVDYASRLGGRVIDAHRNNLLAFNSDTPIAGTLGRDYLASPDQDIEHALLLRIGQMWKTFKPVKSTAARDSADMELFGRSDFTFDATPAARRERTMKADRQSCGL